MTPEKSWRKAGEKMVKLMKELPSVRCLFCITFTGIAVLYPFR
jgi:hypothetical protein